MVNADAKCTLIPSSNSMQQCIDTYGIEGEGEWVNNSISREALFWSCGMVSRKGTHSIHSHDVMEVARCRSLSRDAASILGVVWPLVGSGSDPSTTPFFVAAQQGAAAPTSIDEEVIRRAFGGTLHPDMLVQIEPLVEGGRWWREFEATARDEIKYSSVPVRLDELLAEWRALLEWFASGPLKAPAFIRTAEPQTASPGLGCVFPQFVLGISDQGSLVGVATHVVR